MSDKPNPFNPYVPPADTMQQEPTGPTPTGLKAICIIAIILGGLGLLGVAGETVALVLGDQMQKMFSPQQPGANEAMADLQSNMQSEIQAITKEYVVFSIINAIVHFLTAVMLLVGAVMTLNASAKGRLILMAGCGLSIVYVLGSTMLQAVIQLQTIPVVQTFTEGMMDAAPRNAEMPSWLSAVTTGAIWAGIAFAAVMALVKIVFYVISVFYLRRPQIAARFES